MLEERFTTHDGGRLRYLTGGSGTPLLMCHGFIGSAENFEDWLDAVLPRRTVVIPDLPGFGHSAALRSRHTPDALARAALAAADHAGATQFDVAGLCLGSSVAMAVRRLRAGAVRRSILHTPLLQPVLVRRRFHVQTGVMTSAGVWPGIVWLAHQRVVSDLYKRLMVEGPDVDPVAAQVNFDNQMRCAPRAAREWLKDGLRCDELGTLQRDRGGTLIIVARHDRLVDVARIQRAVRAMPAVELAVIEDAGHAWTEAMGRRQRECIAAFLDGLPLPEAAAA